MRKIIATFILTSFTWLPVYAAKIAVTVGDGTLQPGTTAGFNVSSGTVANLNTPVIKSTGTWTLTGSTITYSNAVINGTRIENSTFTMKGEVIARTDGVTPSAGQWGETISSTVLVSTNYGSTGVFGDLASIQLSTGNWLLFGGIQTFNNGSSISNLTIGITSTPGNSSTGFIYGENWFDYLPSTSTSSNGNSVAGYYVGLSANTTYYLKYEADYTVATPKARGRLRGVRLQ